VLDRDVQQPGVLAVGGVRPLLAAGRPRPEVDGIPLLVGVHLGRHLAVGGDLAPGDPVDEREHPDQLAGRAVQDEAVPVLVDGFDGLVTVADSDGRILASWGSRRILRLAADSNLATWSTWSEWATGTNGMGTALESHRPVMVRGPEHWCRGFQSWRRPGVRPRHRVT